MSGSYKIIDESTWKRAVHCQVFRNSIEPSYCITVELDISNFQEKLRSMKYSFTLSLIYVVSTCANRIEEFRYRFLDNQIVLFDRINTAFTHLDKESELFKVVNVDMQDTLEAYLDVAANKVANQRSILQDP